MEKISQSAVATFNSINIETLLFTFVTAMYTFDQT